MKKLVVKLDAAGLNRLVKKLEAYEKRQTEKAAILLQRLADEGYEIVRAGFENAIYDGSAKTEVRIDTTGENVKAVVAAGNAVLFIEFGTGITYPDIHPEAAENGMIRGEYGQKKGRNQKWAFYGEPGSNGIVVRETSKGKVVLTQGNPANMPVYNAIKRLQERLPELAKEVFDSD